MRTPRPHVHSSRRSVPRTVLCAALTVLLSAPLSAAESVVREEFMVPASDPGIELFVRNKRPRDLAAFQPANIVVFVHGATYPAESSIDLPLDGFSWLDHMAREGFDAYLFDVRGYGRSTRPAEMELPPERHPPLVRTEVAASDLGAVVDFVMRRRGVARLNVVGWSWGTVVAALYTTQNPAKISRLALVTPLWLRQPTAANAPAAPLGAYRVVTLDDARKRQGRGLPPGAEPMPGPWIEAWLSATFATDPAGAGSTPPFLRAPNGAPQDARDYWQAGKPRYDPAELRVPTLLVAAEWDPEAPVSMAQSLYARLTAAAPKKLVIVREASHTLPMERNRLDLFREVQTFFRAGPPGGK